MRVKYDIAQNVNSIAICCGFFKKLRKKSRVFRFFIMLSMSCFVALLTVASCSRCSKSKELLDDNNKTEPIDIPIAINVGHTEDPEMKQLVDAEYEITHENDNNLYIDINSDYYKKYLSRERFNASRLAFFENSENVEYLTLNLDIVNNTDQNLSINEMYIDVDKSEIDTVPVIYICTTDNYSNCIHFVNQSWFDWKGFTFSYSILEKGESFDGHYKKVNI